MPTTKSFDSTSVRRSLVGALLLIAALAGTGCGDTAAPTAPDAGEIAAEDGPTAAKRARNPYITKLQIASNGVFFGTDSGSVVFNVELANPGGKTADLYLAGMVQQGALVSESPAMTLRCTDRDGIMPHGTCSMRVEMYVGPGAFTDGFAYFRLKLIRRGSDGTTLLDYRLVAVTVVHV